MQGAREMTTGKGFLTADDVQQNKIHFSFAHRAVDIGAVGLEA